MFPPAKTGQDDPAVYQPLRIITRSAPKSANARTNPGPIAPLPPPPDDELAAAVGCIVSVALLLVTLPKSFEAVTV